MPQLVPMTQADLARFVLPADCVRKDVPVTDFSGPTALDEQRFEFLGPIQTDSKLIRQDLIFPCRAINCAGSPQSSIQDDFNELQSNPDFYWNQVAWGQQRQFGKTPGGQWAFDIPIALPDFLVSLSAWAQVGASFEAPAWDNTARFVQFICPQLWTPKNYQIWRVTGRWFYASVSHPDTGTFPLPFPWSLSTDFALVSSGALQPGQTIVIPPHDFEPSGNVQSPPAPGGFLGTSDGDGWGVGQYLVFL